MDDNIDAAELLAELLNAAGCDTTAVHDGPSALAVAEALQPHVALLDIGLPVMDGYEFLKELRQMPGGTSPKVVFCTTENDVGHIARALHAGANEYIMKPFDKDIMTAKLQEVGLV